MDEPRCTILLEDDVPVDARKYGDIVAPALPELTRLEVKLAVRRGRGIFLENIAVSHARRIAAELGKDGIRAHVLPVVELPALPAPRRVNHLEHHEEILSYAPAATEGREALPWDALLVASLGVVARPRYQEMYGHIRFDAIPAIHQMEGLERDLVRENLILKMESGPPSRELSSKRKPESIFEEIEKKHGFRVQVYADLLTADLGTWLRIPMEEIGYVYLEGAVRMGGAWGFQLLVNDLKDKCAAALPPMALKLLDAADIKELVFLQIEEFNRYTAWCALKRSLWPNAASSSPSPGPPGPPTGGDSSNASPGPEAPSTSS